MNAKTAAQRQREWRAKRKAEGYQMHTVWLDPDVSRALDKFVIESETPNVERQRLINSALRELLDVKK